MLAYLLADHLGSTVGAIDARGSIYTNKYWPFGGQRGASESYGDKAFTGQQQELGGTTSLNAYYYRARFYSRISAISCLRIQQSDAVQRSVDVRSTSR